MRTILVAGSKGGSGKSTVASNLAARFALDGKATVLVDADPQHSSLRWCEKRAPLESAVLPIDGTRADWRARIPDDSDVVVIDAAAGALGPQLKEFLQAADVMVVPVIPSVIDLEATVPFLDTVVKNPRVNRGKLPVGLVGNRLKPWTNATQQVVEQLKAWPYPLVAQLRDSQAYVLLAGLGKSIFDYHSEQVRNHQADWEPLVRWVKRA